MPQLSTLILTDREATPVDHTFTPRDITQGVGAVVESSGSPIGDNRMTISMKSSNQRYKPEVRFTFPSVQNEVVNGVTRPVVVRTAYVDIKFNFDASSTQEERNNIIGMVESALGADKTLINDTVVKLEGVY